MALSYITRVADGIQTQFDFPFGYLSKSHVFVFVDNTLASYKWIGDFLVETLVPPLPGQTVTIRRLTDRANRVTTFTDGQTLLAESLNAGDLQVFFIAQEMIDQVEEGIVTGDVSLLNPGSGYITSQWIQDQLTANLAAAPQFGAINAAILGEATTRALEIAAEAAARAAAIGAEATARGAAITAEAATRTADVLALTAADAATVGRLNIVESDLNTPTTGVKAKLVTVENAVTTETTARATADTAILAEIDTPGTGLKARATSLESRTTAVEANKAEASALTALTARVGTAETAITTEASTRATADTAISSSVTALTSRVGTAEGSITAVQNAITAETGARVSAVNALDARVGPVEAGLVTVNTAVSNLQTGKADVSTVTALTAAVTDTSSRLSTINLNSRFEEGPAANGILPYRWEQWSTSPLADIVAKPAGLGTGLCLRSNAVGGTPSVGWMQSGTGNSIRAGESYRLRARVKLESGSMTASALLVLFSDAAGTFLAFNTANYIALGSEADVAGLVSSSSTTGIRTFEKLVTAPATAVNYRVFALSAWSSAGALPATSPLMFWLEAALQQANGQDAAVTRAFSAITSESAARAAGDSASATTINALRADTQIRGFLNFNPYFDQPTASPGVPAGWADWIGAAAVTTQVARAVAPLAGLNARTVALLSTNNVGVEQYLPLGGNWGGRSVAARARVRIHSGSNAGAGMYVIFYNADYSVLTGEYKMIFSTEPNTSGIVSTSHAGSTTYEKVLKVPPNTHNIRIIALTNYPGVFGTGTVKALDWYECAISEVGGGVAGVTDLRQAITTNNSSTARLLLSVNTATNVATIQAVAQSGDGVWNGSKISFTADTIELNGNVLVNGTVLTDKLAPNAVSQVGTFSDDNGTGAMPAATWNTIASVTQTFPAGTTALINADAWCRGRTDIGQTAAMDVRILRSDGVVIRQRPATLLVYTNPGTNVDLSDTDAPPAGTFTYSLQVFATLSGGSLVDFQARNRLMTVMQLRR